MTALPHSIGHVGVPPVKCQGIKTKLVPFILSNVKWNPAEKGRWIEPFLGSGVVTLNLAPHRALLADTNTHIIHLYEAIYRGEFTQSSLREFLECEGKKLEREGADYFYEVRKRFNHSGSTYDFVFLNRSCFNGVMRFNRKGEFNVPFGHKPLRFSKAYITKIVNQVGWVAKQMKGKDWEFRVAAWDTILSEAGAEDFVYIDPPYVGRHTDYYNSWDECDAERLACATKELPCGYAVSMWLENVHRHNHHVERCWSHTELRICTHFYHVGSHETLRNEMDEALMIKPGFAMPDRGKHQTNRKRDPSTQLALALERRADYRV